MNNIKPNLPNKCYFAALSLTMTLFAGTVRAAQAPAGAVIGNQATGTYTDINGETRVVTSNLTETLVAQVASLTISSPQTLNVAPGGTAYLPHVINNTGNGGDVFDIIATDSGGDYTFVDIELYADADGNGRPDSLTPITSTPVLQAGESFGVVLAATTPTSASSTQSATTTITVTSQFDNTQTTNNLDQVLITDNAVVDVTKAFSRQTSTPGGSAVTVTISYTNTGGSTATNLNLTDILESGLNYVPGSARWSGSLQPLTDDNAPEPSNAITFTASGSTLEAIVSSLNPGQSGTVSFDVVVDGDAEAGQIGNIVDVTFDDGSGSEIGLQTNQAILTVSQISGLIFSDTGSNFDSDGTLNDRVTIDSVAEGEAMLFDLQLENSGNASETFNLSVLSENFPLGTTFVWLRSDNQTPFTDSNGDGIPDSGPLAAGESIAAVVKVILPSDAPNSGPFDATVQATALSSGESDNVALRLTSITAASADLTANAQSDSPSASGVGVQATGEASAVVTEVTSPGQDVTFSLFVNNTSTGGDNFDLAASTDATFATQTLPDGWRVRFINSDGATITNSGQIAAGASTEVTAIVSIPSGTEPLSNQSVFFRILSPVSGATDVLHDAITVSNVHDLAFQSSRSGQVYPGGTTEYLHTLTNLGNIAEATATLSVTNDQEGWSSVIYHDANGNGRADSGEPIVDDIADFGGLPAGASEQLVVRVYSAAGATIGTTQIVSLEVTLPSDSNNSNNAITDLTTVVSGDVTLVKQQALDADCDGTPETAFTTGTLNDSRAIPGACVAYSISMRNLGSAAIDDAVIRDRTPAFTLFTHCASNCSATGGTVTTPADNSAGEISGSFGSLSPGEEAVLFFTVMIEP